MKTLVQFVPQLFADYSNDLSKITESQNKLGSISPQTSGFQNCVNVAKLVSAQTNASKFAVNMFDSLSNIVDNDFNFSRRISGKAQFEHITSTIKDECSETLHSLINILISKLGNNTLQEIGYYMGVPIYCVVATFSEPSGVLYTQSGSISFYFGKKDVEGDLPILPKSFLDIDFTPYDTPTVSSNIFTDSIDDVDPWSFKANAMIEGTEVTDWFVGNIDMIINSIYNDYISNDCVSSIIKRAQTDGVISRDQVESILNQYQTTNLGEAIKSLIAGTGKLDSISLITLIGKIYRDMGANYDDQTQTETFTVYDAPTFVRSIIQVVVNVVIVATAILLSLIFRVIGVIITLIATVAATVVSLIQQNITKTNAKIVSTSLTPLIDNPLLTLSMYKSQLTTWISKYWNNTSIDEVEGMLQEYGCAMVAPTYTGSAPYYWWILPKDRDDDFGKYTVQLLIPVSNTRTAQSFEVPSMTHNETISVQSDWGFNYVYANSLLMTLNDSGSDVSTRDGEVDTEYNYIKLSDDSDNYQMRKILNINVMKALCDLCVNASDVRMKSWGNICVMYPTGDDQFSICERVGIDQDYYIDSTKCTITQLLRLVNHSVNASAFSQSPFEKLVFFTQFYSLYARQLAAGVDGVSPPTWDELTDLFEFVRNLSTDFLTYMVTKLGVYTNARLQYENLNDGHTLANPAVEWPNLSKSALIRALVVSGVAIAAIAGIAVGLKVGLKKVAFNRLASRQATFNEASKRFERMKGKIAHSKETMGGYTKAEIKQITNDYYKANKKLTRAWSFAGKFGLSMFNGFATSSSDNSFSDAPSTSPLSETTMNSLNNMISDPFEEVNVNDIEASNAIISLIRGPFPTLSI